MEKKILSVTFNVISDILILISLVFAILTFTLGRGNFFSPKIGTIQSKSMEASGYYVGDTVTINKKDNYNVGDVIVFYRCPSKYNNLAKDVDKSKYQIWIHKIKAILVDELDRDTFLTYGTSNIYDDGFYVPEDFVLGEANLLPKSIGDFLSFITSSSGIIAFIIIPSSLVSIYLLHSLIITIFDKEDKKEE